MPSRDAPSLFRASPEVRPVLRWNRRADRNPVSPLPHHRLMNMKDWLRDLEREIDGRVTAAIDRGSLTNSDQLLECRTAPNGERVHFSIRACSRMATAPRTPAGWDPRERLAHPDSAGLGRADAAAVPLRIESTHGRLDLVQVRWREEWRPPVVEMQRLRAPIAPGMRERS